MPFDSAPQPNPKLDLSVVEKLRILRELLPQSGDQASFNTCLWSEVRGDRRLLVAGLFRYDNGWGAPPSEGVWNFFGLERYAMRWLFSELPKLTKLDLLDRFIAEAEAAADTARTEADALV